MKRKLICILGLHTMYATKIYGTYKCKDCGAEAFKDPVPWL